jgi:hypothetical protein
MQHNINTSPPIEHQQEYLTEPQHNSTNITSTHLHLHKVNTTPPMEHHQKSTNEPKRQSINQAQQKNSSA